MLHVASQTSEELLPHATVLNLRIRVLVQVGVCTIFLMVENQVWQLSSTRFARCPWAVVLSLWRLLEDGQVRAALLQPAEFRLLERKPFEMQTCSKFATISETINWQWEKKRAYFNQGRHEWRYFVPLINLVQCYLQLWSIYYLEQLFVKSFLSCFRHMAVDTSEKDKICVGEYSERVDLNINTSRTK